MSVLTCRQWGLIESKHSTGVFKQWKCWSSDTVTKKKSTKVLSCLDHLLLEEEKDILLFLLSLSGMLQTAKCLQKDEHWHQSAKRTQCSVRRIFFVTLPPLQTRAPSLPHREENLRTERVTVDISIKFIQRKIFFSNFRKCCIFIKIFVMWYYIFTWIIWKNVNYSRKISFEIFGKKKHYLN